ncbi:MAG TPA: CsgG/HfaB family protein [Gemmatimonadaceae bacterium]|nr:CsgG/HfaB family protein [Gemmatimonadaceae bacterium]
MKQIVRMAWALVLAGALAAPAAAAAQGANKPVVAVLSFDNNSIGKDAADYNGIGKGIADFLITDMASNPSVALVDRDKIQQVLQEQNLVKQGAVDPQTAVRVGKLLGAQYMVTGGFMSDGRGTMVLTARSINVETGAITNPQRVQSRTDDVLGLIAQLSGKVSKDMKLPAMDHGMGAMDNKKMGDVGAKPQQKMDLRTAMLYAKALDAKDSGDNAKAVTLFRQVLDKFPDYTPAKQNLKKVAKSGD